MNHFFNLKESINFFFICISIIELFFCLILYKQNRKLNQQIINLKVERKEILERKIMKEKDNDLVSIQNISSEKKETIPQKKVTKSNKLEPKPPLLSKQKLEYVPTMKKNIPQEKKSSSTNHTQYKASPNKIEKTKKVPNLSQPNHTPNKNHTKTSSNTNLTTKHEKIRNDLPTKKVYQKNILQTNNKVTSPVSISNQDTFNIDKLSFDLNEFIKKSEKVVPKIEEKKNQQHQPDYLKEISKQMEKSLEPDPIELTDYEKEQEEHAIISYQELLSVKNNIKYYDDEEETIDFIEELKNFRNTLD